MFIRFGAMNRELSVLSKLIECEIIDSEIILSLMKKKSINYVKCY
jgi:hypothetical protein